MAKLDRKWVWYISDLHCNSRFGLLLPDTKLPPMDDQGGWWTPQLTQTQEQLAEWWESDLDFVNKMCGRDDILVIVGGDVTHGDNKKYPDKELVSPRNSDQHFMAKQVFERLASWKRVKAIRFAKGTGSHVMGHGTAEMMLAESLSDKHDVDARAWYHADITYGGVRFDVAHHGPSPGIRYWTAGNQVRYYTRSLMLEDLAEAKTPPDFFLRGHYHEYRNEEVCVYRRTDTVRSRCIICPSYSLADDFIRKATKSKRNIQVGGVLIEIVDGRVIECHEDTLHNLDLARREILD